MRRVCCACSEIRPWIEINPRFLLDLRRFHCVAYPEDDDSAQGLQEIMASYKLPRVDFGASLVAGILTGTKRVTMRLLSDATTDLNSDLERLHEFSLVVATTENSALGPDEDRKSRTARAAFALLRIQRVETSSVRELNQEAIHFSTGLKTQTQVLALLQQFYPHVTAETPLLMVYFDCLQAL